MNAATTSPYRRVEGKPGERLYGAISEFMDFRGKLAQHRGDRIHQDGPRQSFYLAVSDLPSADWPNLIGKRLPTRNGNDDNHGWSGHVFGLRGGGYNDYTYVDTRGWELLEVIREIPKPRDGKTYTWRWSNSLMCEWVKDYFHPCHACSDYHNPEIPSCGECGACHKPGKGKPYSDGSRCEA